MTWVHSYWGTHRLGKERSRLGERTRGRTGARAPFPPRRLVTRLTDIYQKQSSSTCCIRAEKGYKRNHTSSSGRPTKGDYRFLHNDHCAELLVTLRVRPLSNQHKLSETKPSLDTSSASVTRCPPGNPQPTVLERVRRPHAHLKVLMGIEGRKPLETRGTPALT